MSDETNKQTPAPSSHVAPDAEQLKELVERAQAIISTSTYPNWHADARAALTTTEGKNNG